MKHSLKKKKTLWHWQYIKSNFFLYCPSKKKREGKRFFWCLHWPIWSKFLGKLKKRKKKTLYIKKSFSTWWNWPNWHKRPKAVPSCWPNAEKAKTHSGPHVIREKRKEKINSQKIQIAYWIKREKERMLIEKGKKGKLKTKKEKKRCSKQHGKDVWYSLYVCGTCLAKPSYKDNICIQIHKH